ncbi:MAG: SprT family zinc-dependent metalloprotease [bacterium]
MKKRIILDNTEIQYTLRTSTCARRVRLSVRYGGGFVVTRPYWVTETAIERFIFEKAEWVLREIKRMRKLTAIPGGKKRYEKYKEEARGFIKERIEQLNTQYGFSYRRIAIRNQKSRWGSCSEDGNLNFNYRLLFLPSHLADYVIVHELCHLQEFNHSKKFWELVSRAIPDYTECRREMRKIVIG